MSVPEEELAEWKAGIDQVVYHTDYERNLHPVRLPESIIHGLNNAVRAGNPVAVCLLGLCHLKLKFAPNLGEIFEPSPPKGIELLEKAVATKREGKKLPAALYQLGECYRLGIGVAKDTKAAARYYHEAAEEPYSYRAAQRQLGILYFDGICVEQDYQQAVHWFQQATQKDDVEGIVRLALCYHQGLGGLEQSYKHALDLWEVASASNHPYANASIGYAYDNGQGYRWDPAQALKYYTLAAEGGDPLGCIGAAWLLLSGGHSYVHVDVEQAQKHLKVAADADFHQAQYLLGQLYISPPQGSQVDIKKGLDMLQKASDSGNHMASYLVGQIYQFGQHGVTVDMKRAVTCYEKAAAKGHEVSKTRVTMINKQLQAEAEAEEEENKKGGKKKKK